MGSRSHNKGSLAVELREATLKDCTSLSPRLRGDDQLELILLGDSYSADVALKRAWLYSPNTWAWEVDGQVEAIGGVFTGRGEHNGWLVCSHKAVESPRMFMEWSRAALWVVAGLYSTVTTDTLVDHDHERWLKWLGFRPVSERKVEGFLFRKYTGIFEQE